MTRALLSLVNDAVFLGFPQLDFVEARVLGQEAMDVVPDEHGQVFGGGDAMRRPPPPSYTLFIRSCGAGEPSHVLVDVLVVERLHDGLLDDALEVGDVDDHAGVLVDLALDRHLQHVVVAVTVGVVALAENLSVLLVAQIGVVQSVTSTECLSSAQSHYWMHLLWDF